MNLYYFRNQLERTLIALLKVLAVRLHALRIYKDYIANAACAFLGPIARRTRRRVGGPGG